MHRFYLPPDECRESLLNLSEADAHHAADVLRLRSGDCVAVLDGVGHEILCTVREIQRKSVNLEVQRKNFVAPSPCRVTLLQAIPKGKLIEEIIEKATELGVAQVVPLLTERVTTRLDAQEADDKQHKWQRVATEAIKQCGQTWLPKIDVPIKLDEFLIHREPFDLALVGSLQNDRRHAREYFEAFVSANRRSPQSVAIWIGPEGDFTATEMDAIKSSGALPVSLGNLVLRSYTAAVAALATIQYELVAPRQ